MTSPRNGKRIDYAEAARLYASGMSLPTVARVLQSTVPTILRALKRTGASTRTIADAVSLAARGNKTIVNGRARIAVGPYDRRSEHVLIAECALGRQLRGDECVHHINCDPLDNRPENLLICTRAYHTALHWRMRKHPYWSAIERKKP